jgi:hypothetical protein
MSCAGHTADNAKGFLFHQHRGQVFWSFGAHGLAGQDEVFAEHIAIEEEKGWCPLPHELRGGLVVSHSLMHLYITGDATVDVRCAVRRQQHEAPRCSDLDLELGVEPRRRYVEARRGHGNKRADPHPGFVKCERVMLDTDGECAAQSFRVVPHIRSRVGLQLLERQDRTIDRNLGDPQKV